MGKERYQLRALLVGDVHLADNPPSIRTETYREDILDKLEFTVDTANTLGVDAYIQLGDLFDNKIPHRNSHYLVQRAMEIFSKAKMPVFIVTGNHDVRLDRLDTLPSQPLGTILKIPNVHELRGFCSEFNIAGVPYHDNPDDWGQYLDNINEDTLVCMHASIFPQSEMPPYDAISAENLSTLIPSKYIAYGHIHTPAKKGAYYKVGRTWFCNRGAISRGSLHGEHLTRQVGCTLFDSDNPEEPFTNIDIPMEPASEVFKLENKQIIEESKERVAEFLDSLSDMEAAWLTVEQIKAHVLESLGVRSHALVDEIFDVVE